MRAKLIFFVFAAIFAYCSIALPQVRTGTITGKVTDAQAGVLPGVTVILSGERGETTAVTIEDGSYHFRALEPGTYNLRFELAGFTTFNREGIIVAGARTITVDVTLQVAGVEETITVTGESPLIDVKQTVIGATFDELKQDVPGATDNWALLGQTPGVRMTGYDVGGSHKSQQSGFESFGIRGQQQVVVDGVIATENQGGTTFYFDYYATEEVRISASSGSDVEMESPGAALVSTIKSGGNKPSALVNYDFTKEGMVGENLDDETRAQGFTGNPTLDFYEIHVDYGGPIVRDKAWIYAAYNRFRIDSQISGIDPELATDVGRLYMASFKGTWQFAEKDKLVGFALKTHKLKPKRGLSASVPPESVLTQDDPGYAWKFEWQRTWSDKFFSSLLGGSLSDTWPMAPQVDPRQRPPTEEVTTDIASGAGMYPFTDDREDPFITFNSHYYIPEAAGSHDFKIGYAWRLENHNFAYNSSSGPIYYYTENGEPFEVTLLDVQQEWKPGYAASDRLQRHGFWVQDTWTPHPRVTLNLGIRFNSQHAYYKPTNKNELTLTSSEWFPFLESMQIFSTETVPGADISTWNAFAPRLGLAWDLTGEGRTVLKASFGRYYYNISTALSGANPGGLNESTWAFQDLDGDRVLSRADELIEEVDRSGGEATVVDTTTNLPFSDELQIALEQQFPGETAFRFLYVRKNLKHLGLTGTAVNLAQAPFLTVPFSAPDPGDPGRLLNLWTTPSDKSGSDYLMAEYPNANSWNYDTIVFGFEKRLTKEFTAQGSFDYQWRDEARNATSISTSPLAADPIGVNWYQNHSRDVATIQKTTNWGFKAIARYQLPLEIGLATNIRVQSGWNYARRADVVIYAGTGVPGPDAGPSLGRQRVFVEDIKNNRSDTVPIWDLRFDKSFSLGKAGSFMVMADIYNMLNSNAFTNFFLATGSYGQVIAALPPRTLKIGLRWVY